MDKADSLVKKTEAAEIFKRNMSLFRQYMPDIYNFYFNYQSKGVSLCSGPGDHFNLLDNNQFVYPADPASLCEQQVSVFCDSPVHCTYSLAEFDNEVLIKNFLHVTYLNKLVELCAGYDKKKTATVLPKELSFLVVAGVGLGFHVQYLTEKHNIHRLVIWEPNTDVFYASLHAMDWEPVFKNTILAGRGLKMVIGQPHEVLLWEVQQFALGLGFWQLARVYFYKHYSSDEFDTAYNKIITSYYSFFSGWGFFDDEIITFAHTLDNFSSETRLLKYTETLSSELSELPVLVLGNGPSIDKDIEFIKSNQDKFVIMACGGSIVKTLYEYQIKPDYVFIIERTKTMVDWIEEVGDDTYFKDVCLITINNTHPEVFRYYEHSIIGLKFNDAGAKLIESYDTQASVAVFPNAGPTGTNAAISFLISKGFKSCLLLGTDLGFRNKEHHHSKKSSYYNDVSGSDLGRYDNRDANLLIREANFGGVIYTDINFDVSRTNLEMQLTNARAFKCYNGSDGIRINGAIPLPVSEFKLDKTIHDKKLKCREIMLESSELCSFDGGDLSQLAYETVEFVGETAESLIVILREQVSSINEVQRIFSKLHSNIVAMEKSTNEKANIAAMFFRGTLGHMLMVVMSNVLDLDDAKSQLALWAEAKDLIVEALMKLVEKFYRNYQTVDQMDRFQRRKVSVGDGL
ncbi:MAG: motility associated factor glycosyltransferase family protein [Pseudomonadales bacterium]|nr:motility associated factor glycosyltransferase family protein [Pseudomonadales bacterium]